MVKNKEVVSGIVGGAFFAVPYLALTLPILPSLAIGAAAFGASELLFSSKNNLKLKDYNRPLYLTLQTAKKHNKYIADMIPKINDEEISSDLREITKTVEEIISAVEEDPKKADKINNFFDYYLPVTTRIVDQYNDIEDKNISSRDGKTFVKDSKNMISEVRRSFKKLLNSLYTSEITNTDADMKVLNTMLKADGLNSIEVDKEEDDE